jgi:hypothetical protein
VVKPPEKPFSAATVPACADNLYKGSTRDTLPAKNHFRLLCSASRELDLSHRNDTRAGFHRVMCRGSLAIFVSMNSHFGHSKVRFSVRSGPRTILVKFIRVRHLAHRGHSIGESKTSVKHEDMPLTQVGGSATLSVTGSYRRECKRTLRHR